MCEKANPFQESCAETCNLCGSSEFAVEMTARDYVSREQFDLVRCQSCGLVRVHPRPHETMIERYYPAGIYGCGKKTGSLGRWFRRMRIARYLGRSEPGRVLDIGCGGGTELQYLRAKGWQVAGVEPDESSCKEARAAGLEVYPGKLEDVGFLGASFDVIMLWHVIEHLPNPRQTLEEVHKLLRPGGMLLLGCPNYSSVDVWIVRENACLEVPRHLYQFTESTLRRLLVDIGFEVTATHWFSFEIGAVKFLQSLLNVMPFTRATPNFLLDWLGAGLYRVRLGKVYRWHLLYQALLIPPLGCVSLLGVALASLFRFSPTIELSAHKK